MKTAPRLIISPAYTIVMGHVLIATPSPSGNFWKVTIDDVPGVAFFSQRNVTSAFYKARVYIAALEAGAAA